MINLNRLSVAALIAGCLSFAAGCGARTVGSGKVTTETRVVGGFSGIELAAIGTVEVTPGSEDALVVDAEDNLLPLIETTVKPDGTLLITFKSGESVQPTKPITYKLTAKKLDRFVLSGSGKIHAAGKWSAPRENISLPGSGSITVDDLQADALTVTLEGSGNVRVAGGASSQTMELSGSGNYEAETLKTDTATVSVSGSGVCKVWAEKRLDANISGSGAVKYRGSPEVRQRVSGSGSVRALGSKAI